MGCDPSVQSAREREILSYFLHNPHAADTLEGIARHRLLAQLAHRTVEETRRALAVLVTRGLITRTEQPGIDPIYGLAADRIADARAAADTRRAGAPIMPMTLLDDFSNPAPWQPFAPDGVTPSTELSLTLDTTRAPPGQISTSARLTASTNALNHTLRRTIAPADLSNLDDIRFWINATRAADGSVTRPFFLELRLASAATPLSDLANTWQRFIPVSQSGKWDTVRVTIADLPASIRGALTTLQLRCCDASMPLTANLDGLLAARDAMVADVDAALQASLDRVLSVGGTAISAVLHPAEGAEPQPLPYLEILQFDMRFARDRTDAAPIRGDYTATGYTLRPHSNAYDLFYQITAYANDRPTQAAMLEFVARTLPARGQFPVNGLPLPMEAVNIAPVNQIGGFRTDRIPLFYRIWARQEVGTAVVVQPPRNVLLNVDQNAA